ncbi:hypothetical protein [Sulfurimonas sp.]|uniref:hypothetical protein n=1 Tax=Sulfurimonas sp. TaxID=2022749 RepID=UPI00286E5F6D|nr:hypothetical protein [Sulfurimonas sp.]
MKNLFIIGTPLQLINAIEAVKHFKLNNNILVIVHRSLEANRVQMDYLKSLYKWEEIIDVEYSRHSSIFKYIDLVKYLKKYSYKYIFISKLEVVPKIVIPNVTKEKVFLLDDGVLTISIYENQIKPNKINKYDFKEIRFLFFGLNIKIKDKINLFTCFDLEPTNGIEIVKNELNFLKETYLQNAKNNYENIYFLGHPLNESLVKKDVYISNLLSLIEKFNKKIIYIPHRGETKEMKNILSSIDSSLFNVVDINMPVELYFLENKIYPMQVIAYYSTALITLSTIYKECEISFISISNGTSIDRDLINIYKIFNQEGFQELNF